MLQVEFRFNARDLERAVLKAAATAITDRVKTVRCSEHGQYARIVATGSSIDNLQFEVSGCCEGMIEDVKSGLRA